MDIIKIEVDDAGVFEEELTKLHAVQEEHDRLALDTSLVDGDHSKERMTRLRVLGDQLDTGSLYVAQMIRRVVKQSVLSVLKPRSFFIGRSKETEKLYRLEEKLHKAIDAVADEYASLQGYPTRAAVSAYWRETMPQILFDILDSYQSDTAYAAAQALIEAVDGRGAQREEPKQ